MRQIFVVVLAAGALAACASDGMKEAAVRQCALVGISPSDPQFDLCARSYTLQANQGTLASAYHQTLNPTYDRPTAHQWYGF